MILRYEVEIYLKNKDLIILYLLIWWDIKWSWLTTPDSFPDTSASAEESSEIDFSELSSLSESL